FDYADKHREELQAYNNASSFINDFSINKELLKEFNSLTKKEGIVFDKKLYNESLSEIKLLLKSLIGRNIYDNEGFYPIYLQTDAIFNRALEYYNQQ
ncbi:MAG: hypothetical protein U9R32_01685, partial [Bacteroidota bacterium]|nr:hypothetical protein [Bacteroidota bacterium]